MEAVGPGSTAHHLAVRLPLGWGCLVAGYLETSAKHAHNVDEAFTQMAKAVFSSFFFCLTF